MPIPESLPVPDVNAQHDVPERVHQHARVRVGTPADAPALIPLFAEHAAYEKLPFTDAGTAARIASLLDGPDPRLAVWVVEAAGVLVGYAAVSRELSTWAAADYLHLDCLFVSSTHRGQGWGALLLTRAREHARSLGLTKLQWQTPPWNEGALGFYRREGATTRDKVRCYLDA